MNQAHTASMAALHAGKMIDQIDRILQNQKRIPRVNQTVSVDVGRLGRIPFQLNQLDAVLESPQRIGSVNVVVSVDIP